MIWIICPVFRSSLCNSFCVDNFTCPSKMLFNLAWGFLSNIFFSFHTMPDRKKLFRVLCFLHANATVTRQVYNLFQDQWNLFITRGSGGWCKVPLMPRMCRQLYCNSIFTFSIQNSKHFNFYINRQSSIFFTYN